jgi:hypothetical protein
MKNRRMKKYISFILVTLLFTACGTDETKLEKVQRETRSSQCKKYGERNRYRRGVDWFCR